MSSRTQNGGGGGISADAQAQIDDLNTQVQSFSWISRELISKMRQILVIYIRPEIFFFFKEHLMWV